jgi:hypothetical protein
MASIHKVFTKDCHDCPKLIALELGVHLCSWGKSKVKKILDPPKGKNDVHCHLKERIK